MATQDEGVLTSVADSAQSSAIIIASHVKPTPNQSVKPLTDTLADNPLKGVDIERFLRKILEDEYSFKKSRQHQNRFCLFFAHLFTQITMISRHQQSLHYSLWMKEELARLETLLYEALHSVDEHFELCFDIAYNAEFYIVEFLPVNESLMFFEAMVNASERHSKLHQGIMLSSLGQVLRIAHKRVPEAYDQYMKALDLLAPLGDSRDLAWLYTHIGYIWYDKDVLTKAERYVYKIFIQIIITVIKNLFKLYLLSLLVETSLFYERLT